MSEYNQLDEVSKAPRIRSVSYPSMTLGDSLELTARIYKIFGNTTYTPRETIARQLHVSESHLQSQVSSSVQFGFLELKSKEGYRPTELFIKLRSPLPDENVQDSFIQSFTNPELYKAIVEQFNGRQLPAEAGLATVLYRKHKVAEKVSEFAAKIFIQSAIECGFLNDAGLFFVGEKASANETVEIIEERKDNNNSNQYILLPPIDKKVEEIEKSEIPPIPIFLDSGQTAKLYMPKGFTKEDLKRVAKVITAYIE